MDSLRLRLTAGLAGVTLAVFAATSYGQQTNTPTTGGAATTPTADQSAPAAQQSSPAPTGGTDATIGTSSRTTTTATDVTTTTPSTSFWLGPWGIAAIAVVAILLLWAIFGRRGDRTVVRDSYSTTNTTRTAPTNERIVSPRAASGETTTRVTDTDTRL